jgi:hypothetical protein
VKLTGKNHQGIRESFVLQPFKSLDHHVRGLVPTDRLPLSLTPFPRSPEGSLNPVRIIEGLNAGQTLRTDSPSVKRMERISNDLHCPTFHNSNQQATATNALLADRGNPFFKGVSPSLRRALADSDSFEIRASCREACHRSHEDFEKVSPGYSQQPTPFDNEP